jgi:hypothetical protein
MPNTSLPFKIAGIACSWIGYACSYFFSATAFNKAGDKPREENDIK